MRMRRTMWMLVLLMAAGCHAAVDDPKGQSEELADPVRREHAIENLQSMFNKALAAAKGDRSLPPVKTFADAAVDNMAKTYLDHPEDSVNGGRLMMLMYELQDPRAIPAMLKALDWTHEVTEDHAVTAARAAVEMDVPSDKKGELVDAICKALGRVEENRGVDNRMRKGFIEVLGKLGDKRATPTLIKIVETQDKNQNFLFNILAAQQLVKLADPTAIPTMIKALYIFAEDNPAMRMNDVATSALVASGKLSLAPLLKVLQGQDEGANAMVKAYIGAIKMRDKDAAARMKPEAIVAAEAAYTLGKLGDRTAIDALTAEAKHEDKDRRFAAALALVSINREDSDTAAIVATLKKVYDDAPKAGKPQMLVAVRHLYASEIMGFLEKIAVTEEKELPPIQMYGFVSHALLANKAEAQKVKHVLETAELIKGQVKDYAAAIKAAEECDEKIDCWVGKLGDKDKVVLRKAANMLARFGRGDEKAINGLLKLFTHEDIEVRNEALAAVDYMAIKGSKAAVDKIEDIEAREQGRSSWNNFKREALPTRSRLLLRTGS